MAHLEIFYQWLRTISTISALMWSACNILRIFTNRNRYPRIYAILNKGFYTGIAIQFTCAFILNPASMTVFAAIVGSVIGTIFLIGKYLTYKDMRNKAFYEVTTKREGSEEEVTFYGEDVSGPFNKFTRGYTIWHFVTEKGRTNFEIASEFKGHSVQSISDEKITSQIPMRFDFWKSKLVYTYAN